MEILEKIKYHRNLSNYFGTRSLFFDEHLQKKPHIRKCMELPFQQTKAEMWDEVTDTLCDLEFIQAKACAKMTYDLVKDFNDVLEVIPDNEETIREERNRQERLKKYTRDLVSFAKAEITELEVPESITPWSQERINTEFERMKTNPTRVDRLKDFLNFIGQEAGNLQNYACEFSYFTTQQAWNYSDSGPVGKAAENFDPEKLLRLLLFCPSYRPNWNPFPQALKTFKGHSGEVTSVRLTTDGKYAISGSTDKTCIFWDLKTGQELKLLKGHTDKVTAVCITPDGKYAFTGSNDKTCIFWDIETGQALKTFKGHTGNILSVSLTPDAKYAVSGSLDDSCIIWDIEIGQPLKTLCLNSTIYLYGGAYAVCISSNGKFVLSGSRDLPYPLILWDNETGQRLKNLEGHSDKVTAVCITPDNKHAFTGSNDKTCIFWDLETGQALKKFKDHTDSIVSVCLTPNAKYAASGSSDKTCILWDLKTGQALKILDGHNYGFTEVDITPDGKNIFSASYHNNCILWDLEISQKSKIYAGHTKWFNVINVSKDGEYTASGAHDETCILWETQNSQIINTFTGFMGMTSAVFTPDGKRSIMYGEWDRTIIIYEIETGHSLRIGHTGIINTLGLVPDGKHAITSSNDKTCILWNLNNGTVWKTFKDHTGIIRKLILTPTGRYAVSELSDKSCIIWDIETGVVLKTFTEHIDSMSIESISITPDGKCALLGSYINTFILWHLESGRSIRTSLIDSHGVKKIVVTPDGKRAIFICSDKQCILIDLKTGLELNPLEGIDFKIESINVTSDGENAISICDNDSSCIIWNLKSGKILERFIGPTSFEAIALYNKGIVAGCPTGRITILHTSRSIFCPGPGIVTIRNIWDFEKHLFLSPSADCPFCGYRFAAPVSVLDTIVGIMKKTGLQQNQSPCLDLPEEAWDEPGLLGNCPRCKWELKFNPFVAGETINSNLY